MNTESLKTFVTLAKLGNFTKTAQQHLVVQSTVSNRIKELELEFDQKLFIRDKKQVELTKAGKLLLKYAQKIIDLEEEALKEMSLLNNFSNILKIGVTNSIYKHHIEKYLIEFIKKYPDISIKIHNGHSPNLLNKLHDDNVDICFSYRPYYNSNYRCIPFYKDELVLLSSSKNNKYKDGINYQDIKNLTILYSDYFSVLYDNWFNELFSENHTYKLNLEVGSDLIPYIKEDMGYGFLPYFQVKNEIENNELRKIDILDMPPMEIYIYIVTKSITNETVDLFLKFIEENKI
ncbi:MAG: LysR family transcriptional regulator [Intestinibacter sp.]|uniref:LysR family transcriptional regulator n=1 Tax=Intestinibacter sp. TaxID=1965304 RepID=UPI003F16CE7F